VHDLTARRIGFKVLTGRSASIDTTFPGGKLVFGIFAALAEFERELIIERTKAGMATARARGRNCGMPYKMAPSKLRMAVASMNQPETRIGDLCAELGFTLWMRRSIQPTRASGTTPLTCRGGSEGLEPRKAIMPLRSGATAGSVLTRRPRRHAREWAMLPIHRVVVGPPEERPHHVFTSPLPLSELPSEPPAREDSEREQRHLAPGQRYQGRVNEPERGPLIFQVRPEKQYPPQRLPTGLRRKLVATGEPVRVGVAVQAPSRLPDRPNRRIQPAVRVHSQRDSVGQQPVLELVIGD